MKLKNGLQFFAPVHIDFQLYVDGTFVCYVAVGNTCDIISNGLFYDDETIWTYSGSGTFIGVSTSEGATTAEYGIGDTITIGQGDLHLYSVTSTGGNEYTLTNSLTNLTHGNITLTITADEGYALPAQSDIVVTGGSIVSYDDTTGELVVTAGTTAVEVTCAVSTISFTVNVGSYQANSGQTWGDWVNSANNTGEFVNNQGYIFTTGNVMAVLYNGNSVLSTDTIIANAEYSLSGGGSN